MKISEKKRQKISEQVLALLYSKSPQALFTSQIAQELARDEEFIKKILLELRNKNLILEIKKNPKGKIYLRRSRWRLSDNTYTVYRNHQ
jgi:DNA-binding IscR family transcriptional regulator